MAPKAEKKVPAVKGDQAEELVLNYLKEQNRPYGSQDILLNLHGAVNKPTLTKALAALVEKGEVVSKMYAKSALYVITQKESDAVDAATMATMRASLETLKSQESELKESGARGRAELTALLAQPTTAELHQQQQSLASSLATLSTEVDVLRAAAAAGEQKSAIPAAEFDNAIAAFEMAYVEAAKRRKWAKGMEGMLGDAMEMAKGASVWEAIGAEEVCDGAGPAELKKRWEEIERVRKTVLTRKAGKK